MDDDLLLCHYAHNTCKEINSDPEEDDPQSKGTLYDDVHTEVQRMKELITTDCIISRMKTQIKQQQKTIGAKKWKLKKYKARAKQQKEKNEKWQREKQKLQESIGNLKSLLQTTQLESGALKESCEAYERAKRESEHRMGKKSKQLASSVRRLQQELEQEKRERESNQSQYKRLESDFENAAVELESERMEKEKFQKKVRDYKKAHDAHLEANQKLREHIQKQQQETLTKGQQFEAEQYKQQKLAKERDNLVEMLQQQVEEAKKQQLARDNECKSLRETLEAMDGNEDCSRCNVVSHAIRMKQMKAEITRLRLLLDIHEIDTKPMESEVASDSSSIESKAMGPLNITLNKKLTECEIPKRCKVEFSNVAGYMTQYISIHSETAIRTLYSCKQKQKLQVIDCNFNCKNTQKPLYVVCHLQPLSHPESDASWHTNKKLYSATDIENKFEISSDDLPKASLKSTKSVEIQNVQKQIKLLLSDAQKRNDLIQNKKTPWTRRDKIPIHNKSARYGLNCVFTKEQFVRKLKQFSDTMDTNGDNIELVPILRCTEHEDNVEMAWMVDIGTNRNIAISLQVDARNLLMIKGIYLNINDAHKLAHSPCDGGCLSNFPCDIDRLEIGESAQMRMYHSKVSKQMNEYNRMKKEDDAVMEEMITACTQLQHDFENTQTFVESLLQKQAELNEASLTQSNLLIAMYIQQQMFLSNIQLVPFRTQIQ